MAEVVNADLGWRPYRHQAEAHKLRLAHKRVVLVWHRRAGKTDFAVMELLLAALAATATSARFAYVAPYLKQAKAVAWDRLKTFARAVPGAVVGEAELSVTLPNGARVRLYGADNADALRGDRCDGVVLDEVADMDPLVWDAVIAPMLLDRDGWALFIGTPKGINLFSKLYQRGLVKEPGWASDMRRASETGIYPSEVIEQKRRDMPPSVFAQEFECDFAAAVENALLSLDAVLAAQQRTLGPHEYHYAPRVLGVDVARYGDDRSVIFPRQGLAALQPKVFRGLDLMALSDQVAQVLTRWKAEYVFIDAGGMGVGVIDRLRQLGHDVIGVDFGGRAGEPRFQNKRAEMWWLMAEWVKSGGSLPSGQELVQDLTAPTYDYRNAAGKLSLESKDDMRERGLPSPDLADALALTFAAPVAIKSELERYREKWEPERFVTDYDPYAERAHG